VLISLLPASLTGASESIQVGLHAVEEFKREGQFLLAFGTAFGMIHRGTQKKGG
tara:strand:+ start:726 stop:887 length:162 start_codon:yes stop_codon:yes gene_type:complete